MSAECLLDTNVLVYAVSASPGDAAKRERAIELIETADFGLSSQVLQEFFVTVTRKLRKPLAVERAVELLEAYRLFPLVPTDYSLILAGIEHAVRHGISYWDGAVVAAAETLHAGTVYTEDLNHRQVYGTVRVVNPFVELG